MAEFWGYIDSDQRIMIRPLNDETLERELDELHTKNATGMLIVITPFRAENKMVAFAKILEMLQNAIKY